MIVNMTDALLSASSSELTTLIQRICRTQFLFRVMYWQAIELQPRTFSLAEQNLLPIHIDFKTSIGRLLWSCTHRVWPTFSIACASCLLETACTCWHAPLSPQSAKKRREYRFTKNFRCMLSRNLLAYTFAYTLTVYFRMRLLRSIYAITYMAHLTFISSPLLSMFTACIYMVEHGRAFSIIDIFPEIIRLFYLVV